MKFTKLALITFAISACSVSAQAQDRWILDGGAYGGIGLITYENDFSSVEAKLGYDFNKYFGVEAQGSVGTNRESEIFGNIADTETLNIQADYNVGAFAIARLPITYRFHIFARGGIHNTQVDIEVEDGTAPDFKRTETGFAAGGGLQYNFSKKNAIRLEYTYLDDIDANTSSLSYVRKF